MIELKKINGKTEKIPTARELTVNQYIKLQKRESINIVNYLSVVLNINYKKAFDLKITNYNALKSRIGVIQDYQKLTPKSKISLNDGNYFYVPDEIETVGQRWMIEENARKITDEELLVFILAVGLVSDPTDFEKVKATQALLMQQPYIDILPTAFFLQLRFLTGRNNELSFSKRLTFWVRTQILRNKRALTNFHHTLIIMRYKLYLRF